ncbi:hypothetical protein ID866_7534 [Astraeus odoratus]|nr:hypothetical protein ID866_7534 [Astraeus odoratus]
MLTHISLRISLWNISKLDIKVDLYLISQHCPGSFQTGRV